MNDFFNEIFTAVYDGVTLLYPEVTVTGEYTRQPSEFPLVTVDETENVSVARLIDSSNREKYSGLTYRIQVFSNKQGGKKAEARDIFAAVDKIISKMGFRRVSYAPTPEIYDSTIYSITATYEAVVDENGNVYKR